ncbi:MAG: hypothetical protein FWF29_09910, partial [Treponema sp.]|nr:hypothetical protein [Treponema sp.]
MNKKYMLVLLILCTALLVFFTACDNSTGSGTKPGPKSGDSTLPAPIHQWLLDGNGNDQVGGKNLTINTDYNTFAQDAGWGHQVMDCAGTNSPDEPYDLCWVPDFNGPVMTELTATVWVNPVNIAGIRGVLTFEKPTSDNAGLYIFNYYGGFLYLTYNENENTNLDLGNDFTD